MPLDQVSESLQGSPARKSAGHLRWLICAFLFGATTINLMNRQVFGILAGDLQTRFHWDEAQYGYIVGAFQLAYAIGLVAVGRLIDRVGTRVGYALMIGVWSLVTIAHVFVRTAIGFCGIRFLLGLSEAGNFPASTKSTAEWFPPSERSFVAGIINAGTNMGVIAAALLVPWLGSHYGWQSAFVVTGAMGLIWCAWWWWGYRSPEEHPKLSAEEYALITGPAQVAKRDQAPPIPWVRLLGYKQLWAFTLVKFLVDPVWFFYLSWLPKYLSKSFHLPAVGLSLPLIIIYFCSDVGSVAGGWLPSVFLKSGYSMAKARRITMIPCALAVIPMVFASHFNSLWVTIVIAGVALAAVQGWSSNVYAIASDLFPKSAVASVVGFGSMAGSIGAALFAVTTGWILQRTGTYTPLFIYSAGAYTVAFLILYILVPNLEPVEV